MEKIRYVRCESGIALIGCDNSSHHRMGSGVTLNSTDDIDELSVKDRPNLILSLSNDLEIQASVFKVARKIDAKLITGIQHYEDFAEIFFRNSWCQGFSLNELSLISYKECESNKAVLLHERKSGKLSERLAHLCDIIADAMLSECSNSTITEMVKESGPSGYIVCLPDQIYVKNNDRFTGFRFSELLPEGAID